MVTADEIREFVFVAIIKPARRRGEKSITIRAGDIHKAMGLTDRMPQVVSSIEADKFQKFANVTLVSRHGPHASSTVTFCFNI